MSNHIIRCPECGAANKIPADKIGVAAKCGKCHTLLPSDQEKTAPGQAIQMRCTECGTKNKIPAGKLDAGGKCGKCGALLKTEELFEPQPIMVTDAPWCTTCGTVAPIIDEFASEAKSKIRVGKLNVEANPMLASKFNILAVPFLFIFDNGQMKESMPGGLQKHEIMMKMSKYI
jgi:thioredoxin 2